MEVKHRRVVWDKPAYFALEEAFNHIKKDSFTAAEKFREKILEESRSLSANPEKHSVPPIVNCPIKKLPTLITDSRTITK